VCKLSLLVLLLLAAPVLRAEQAAPKGDAEFRAGWLALVAPMSAQRKSSALQARQEARIAALPHFEAAAKADPDNVSYRTALGYVYLAAGKYQLAKETLDEAVARSKRDPLLYLLRGQADAALAQMEPETASAAVERVMRSFDDAARLDPTNSLAGLQAASVAFDAGRRDLGLKKLTEALQRPGMTLYRLPIPGDLHASRSNALRIWQYIQVWQWLELISRCDNVVKTELKLGGEKQETGDLDGAQALYEQALQVARRIGNARPNTIVCVNSGINAMEDSYVRLLELARKKSSKQAEQWEGELGVLQIGRSELQGILQTYLKRIEENPPDSVEALLEYEGESVGRVMLGIGLTPAKIPEPMVLPKQPKG
jgi:tetratricopeptide (TPR) repeat protein